MKIEGPKQTQSTKSTGSAKKTSAADKARFSEMMAAASGGASETGATQSIASMDALLAVQGAEDPTARAAKRRMKARADDLLQELDRIRMGLLNGNLTVGHVIDIADVVASHREKITDPRMTAILDEIDLRAQIEIAKMRKALDNQNG
ncbi:MAG: flagellar assembly protein FliX [Rhodospirillales bacterium]|nr:flagellar assembly protein FliX [Rhodospirillales bacterium]